MRDIFDEADAELKEIQKRKLIKYATYVFIILAICAILFTMFYKWNKNRSEQKILAISNQFLAVFEQSNQDLSNNQIDQLKQIAAGSDSSFSAISYLILAKRQYDSQDFSSFVLSLNAITKDKSYDIAFRDLAILNLTNYYLSEDKIDLAEAEIQKTNIEKSPYRFMLMLNRANILLKQNKFNEAKITLSELSSNSAVPDQIAADSKALIYLINKMGKNA